MLANALTILAVVVAQTPSQLHAEPPPPPAAPAKTSTPPESQAGPAIPLAEPRLVAQPSYAKLVPEGAPALRVDRMTRCFDRGDGRAWRAQCDATAKTCLVAPDAELSDKGERQSGLDRAPACATPGWREQDLASQGYRFLPALAETPPGWYRDERQRVMQVNFDLNRRIWLGAGYGVGGLPHSDNGEATAGVRADAPILASRGINALARIRAFETYATFDGELVDFTLFGVDFSAAYQKPLLRLTTFFGKPRRFDPPLFFGGWIEALHVETQRTSAGWFDRTELGAAALTLDLWHSRDLSSFVRLRGGAGWETADQLSGGAWTPHAAFDVDVTLNPRGYYVQHLRATGVAEWLVTTGHDGYQPTDETAPRLPEHRTRYTAKAEYEMMLVAINDQPISAVLDVRAQNRNDVPGFPTGWNYQGTASLRFNLWAPPRRDAPTQDRL